MQIDSKIMVLILEPIRASLQHVESVFAHQMSSNKTLLYIFQVIRCKLGGEK